MPTEGWRKLVEIEWAGCVILHNLPFSYCDIKIKKLNKPMVHSVIEIHGSASEWNYYDFIEQACQNR